MMRARVIRPAKDNLSSSENIRLSPFERYVEPRHLKRGTLHRCHERRGEPWRPMIDAASDEEEFSDPYTYLWLDINHDHEDDLPAELEYRDERRI